MKYRRSVRILLMSALLFGAVFLAACRTEEHPLTDPSFVSTALSETNTALEDPITQTATSTRTETSESFSHEHLFGEWICSKQSSCTASGEEERLCSVCGETEKREIGATGHKPVTDEAIGATCTTDGKTEGSHCAVCGEVLAEQETIKALRHTPVIDRAVAATCTEDGKTAGCSCSVCGEILIAPRVIPAKGHTPETKCAVDPTCTKEGRTEEQICAVCGIVLSEGEVIAPLGHTSVVEKALLPTAKKSGYTGKEYCSVCGEVLCESLPLEAKGTDFILEDGVFKLLLIGNSFSQDAANYGFSGETNMLLSSLEALLGEDVDILIGVCQSGSKTMAWHASTAEAGRKGYSFHTIDSREKKWVFQGEVTSAYALSFTDWDFVSLQPYADESQTGVAKPKFPDEENERFYPLSVSIPYMLDHVEKYAPQADVYLYMQWASTADIELNAVASKYERIRTVFPTLLTYTGEESGKPFEEIIPVGLAIQNLRSTYISLLNYHTNDPTRTQQFDYDAQFGLSRDGLHLSYNIGRYVASLTFALTLVPDALRVADPHLPGIRESEAIGKLPEEYTLLAQKAVEYAVDTYFNEEDNLKVVKITGYEKDPAYRYAEKAFSSPMILPNTDSIEKLKESIIQEALARTGEDVEVLEVSLQSGFPPVGTKSFSAEITLRYGYTTVQTSVQCRMSQ